MPPSPREPDGAPSIGNHAPHSQSDRAWRLHGGRAETSLPGRLQAPEQPAAALCCPLTPAWGAECGRDGLTVAHTRAVSSFPEPISEPLFGKWVSAGVVYGLEMRSSWILWWTLNPTTSVPVGEGRGRVETRKDTWTRSHVVTEGRRRLQLQPGGLEPPQL